MRPSADAALNRVNGAGPLGVALAALGLGLHQLTGDSRWAAASIAVGAVLVGIAFELGRDIKSLLLGEGAYPGELAALRAVFSSHDDVVDLVDMLTMRLARRCGRSPSTLLRRPPGPGSWARPASTDECFEPCNRAW